MIVEYAVTKKRLIQLSFVFETHRTVQVSADRVVLGNRERNPVKLELFEALFQHELPHVASVMPSPEAWVDVSSQNAAAVCLVNVEKLCKANTLTVNAEDATLVAVRVERTPPRHVSFDRDWSRIGVVFQDEWIVVKLYQKKNGHHQ